jgi:hypothetical protein
VHKFGAGLGAADHNGLGQDLRPGCLGGHGHRRVHVAGRGQARAGIDQVVTGLPPLSPAALEPAAGGDRAGGQPGDGEVTPGMAGVVHGHGPVVAFRRRSGDAHVTTQVGHRPGRSHLEQGQCRPVGGVPLGDAAKVDGHGLG